MQAYYISDSVVDTVDTNINDIPSYYWGCFQACTWQYNVMWWEELAKHQGSEGIKISWSVWR